MSISAIVLAGGSGTRINTGIPKQFICVMNKPIVMYTLDVLEFDKNINDIVIACNKNYIELMKNLVVEYQIGKVRNIVPGGDNVLQSTFNALNAIKGCDIVMVFGANRPLFDSEMIEDCINVCKINGNAISAMPCVELTYKSNDGKSSSQYINRDTVWKTYTPQAYKYLEMKEIYDTAFKNGIPNYASTSELYVNSGKTIFFSKGKSSNIKITYPEDLELFEALLKISKN